MATVNITHEEYQELLKAKDRCVIDMNNYMIPVLKRELTKFRLMIQILKDGKSFKHDKIKVPGVGEFSLSKLKEEIENL